MYNMCARARARVCVCVCVCVCRCTHIYVTYLYKVKFLSERTKNILFFELQIISYYYFLRIFIIVCMTRCGDVYLMS